MSKTQKTTTALYDALTLEIGRADSLAGLLAERLSDLDERPDAPSELYALSLVAESVSDKLQLILTTARALHEAKTVLLPVDPETAATYGRKKNRPRALRVVAATPSVAKKGGA
jgi:hypothetical protein